MSKFVMHTKSSMSESVARLVMLIVNELGYEVEL